MKTIHLLVLVILGIFLMPTPTFACGGNSKKHSCTKEMSSGMDKKDCCESHSKSKNHDGCNGKCGQALCSTPVVNIGIFSYLQLEIKNNSFNFSTKKQKFYQSETFTSDGYSSIWLIPKIS